MPLFNRITNALAAPSVLFYALPWLMALVTAATVTQPSLGLYEAVEVFMNSWIIWLGIVPLPGGLPTLAVLTINLLARFLFKSEWQWRKAGIHLTHLGVLVLLLGGLVTLLTMKEGYMVIPEGRESAQVYAFDEGEIKITPPSKPGESMNWGHELATLPFTVTLTDFVRETHPGTSTPSRYYSDIVVNGTVTRIDMNAPLRLQGWTLYQSSFFDVGTHQATVLQAVHNDGRVLPYVAGLLMTIGLIVHLLVMKGARP